MGAGLAISRQGKPQRTTSLLQELLPVAFRSVPEFQLFTPWGMTHYSCKFLPGKDGSGGADCPAGPPGSSPQIL